MDDKEGFEVAVKASRTILRVLGIWPNHHERTESWLSRSYFIMPTFILVYFTSFPQTMEIIKVWGDLNSVLELLTTFDIPNLISLIKILSVWYNKKVLGLLIMAMENDWKSLKTVFELRVMWKNVKLGRLITLAIYLLTYSTVATYVVMAVYITANAYKQEFILTPDNSTKLRPQYMRAHFAYDVQKSPVYEIVWIFQCIAMHLAGLSFMAIDSLFSILVLHLCGQLINLQERLKNVTENLTKRHNLSYQLSRIVMRHEQLDRFAKAIENAFNTMFLAQILLSGVVLCLQGYQIVIILTSRDTVQVTELLFMIYFILCIAFSLFIYCYIAEILRTESTEIGNAAYECNWYDLPACETRLFILTMIRSKTPFEITAGKFTAFSLQLYCSILKTSGGYLSMLLAVKERLAL
ncbi:odorant receptor 16 [Nasonia vitripennis]|uniref:Odorant receptor n=1 Tax=Nasonia vitripennis TaxID=7425 RepID=A0A7M6UGS9_NASVI|nr:odorant receptor 16 [Nasonia vitripennis]